MSASVSVISASSTGSPPSASRNASPTRRKRRAHLGKFYYRPPSGESWADLGAARCGPLLLRYANGSAGGGSQCSRTRPCSSCSVTCSRHSPKRRCLELGAREPLHNGAITRYESVDGVGLRLVGHDLTDHLDAEGTPLPGSMTCMPKCEPVTVGLLRSWPLPEIAGTKDDRGVVLVVGGSTQTVGAVVLAGEAALRVGAGKVQIATVVVTSGGCRGGAARDSGVPAAPRTRPGSCRPGRRRTCANWSRAADVVLIGPGLAGDEHPRAGGEVAPNGEGPARSRRAGAGGSHSEIGCGSRWAAGPAVLTPNLKELAITLGVEDVEADVAAAAAKLAHRTGAVVHAGGENSITAAPDGLWRDDAGAPGSGCRGLRRRARRRRCRAARPRRHTVASGRLGRAHSRRGRQPTRCPDRAGWLPCARDRARIAGRAAAHRMIVSQELKSNGRVDRPPDFSTS